jgi:Alginate export
VPLSAAGMERLCSVARQARRLLLHQSKGTAAATLYWRQSLGDGIYGSGLNLVRPDGGSRARYIGTQGELGIGWQATRNLNFRATYSLFKPGQFYRGDRTCQNRPLRSDSGGVQVLTRQPHGQC